MSKTESQPEVIVVNESPHTIWVVIAEHKQSVIETKTRTISDTDFETYYKWILEGKVASPIKGEVSSKNSGEFKYHLKQHYENNKEEKFEWSGFIDEGELEIPSKQQDVFARKADEPIYYVTIRTMDHEFPAKSVPRQDTKLTLKADGTLANPIPMSIKILNNSPVYFQKQDEGVNFVGDPLLTNYKWDGGTFGNTGGSHKLVCDKGELEAGKFTRIVSLSKTLSFDGYKYLYCSQIGNTYYDKLQRSDSGAGKKQLWKIDKTSHKDNSSGDKLHYGDRAKISNANWPKSSLGVNGKWLQCMNYDATIWILRAEAKT